MVVVSDLVDDPANIHPVNKIDVSSRLANIALSETYGMSGLNYKFPMYKGMKNEKDKIRILFDNADNGLMAKDKTINKLNTLDNDTCQREYSMLVNSIRGLMTAK